MLITGDQLLCHLFGDYVFQSDWMASEKTKQSFAALCHAVIYGLCLLPLAPTLAAWLVIVGTHFVIDRWRLARYVVYAKNFLAPQSAWHPWSDCTATGYHKDRPAWLAGWLLIIADNALHISINGLALKYAIG